MNRIVLSAICLCLYISGLYGQNGSIHEVLEQIGHNNKELKAHRLYLESRDLNNQTSNNLDDLRVSGAWLPFGNNNTRDYLEFQVGQSFEFPSAYKARNQYMENDRTKQEAAYLEVRQKILADGNDVCTRLIFQYKRKAIETQRTEEARKVYDQVQKLYEKEQVGKLDLNKSKVAWLQQQFSTAQTGNEISRLLIELRSLNGGGDIVFSSKEYDGGLSLMQLDSLWQQKLAIDPAFRYLEESEKTALANIEVQKKERLPVFDIGLNFEGYKGENYAGMSGGLSIPVWNRKNTVKAAQAHYVYENARSDALASKLFSDYKELYTRFSYLLEKYFEYKRSMDGLDSESLLFKAYELGELSYLEYYMELQFYRVAIDEMLIMEQELHLLKNELLKHNL